MNQANTQNPQLNFAQILNIKISPNLNPSASSGDYRAAAHYIANMEDLWSAPLLSIQDTELINQLKDLCREDKHHEALDILNDFIISETKINLTNLIANYPEDLKEGIPTTMTIFGGFTNAVSIHLALAKITISKLRQNNQLAKVPEAISGLEHSISQFAKLQACTLKLIENMNGVISNQEKAYDFDPGNFEFSENQQGKLVLLPTMNFINRIIKKANSPDTQIQSYNYKDGHSTAFIETKNFAETYSKPKGCTIHASNSSDHNLLDKFLDQITTILIQITCSK